MRKTVEGNAVERAASKREPAVEIRTAKGRTVLKPATDVTVKAA